MTALYLQYGWPLLVIMNTAFCFGGIYYLSGKLVELHANYIRLIWYLFSLLAIVTWLIAYLLVRFEAMDAKGHFHGQAGQLASQLLTFVFALNEDMLAAGAIIVVVIGPQVISYLMSGIIAGCAGPIRYTEPVIRILLLNLAKSFVMAAGVMLGLATYSVTETWTGVGDKQAVGLMMLSLILVLAAFYLISQQVELTSIAHTGHDTKAKRILRSFDKWMKRAVAAGRT